MSTILAIFKIIRPVNSVMMGLSVCFSEILAYKSYPNHQLLVYGFLTGFSLTGYSMVINDIYDYEVDLINAPKRPLPSGLISIKEAWFYGFLLLILGLVSAYSINTFCFIIAIISSIISTLYNMYFKKHGIIGNLMVSFCVSMPFIFGSYAVNGENKLLIVFSLVAFLVNTGREIIKGIADVEGDKEKGIKSVAVTRGIKIAAYLAICFFVLAITIVILPIIYGLTSLLYIPFIIPSVAGLIFESYQLIKDCDPKKSVKIKNRILLYMFLALIAMFLGGYYEEI
ncbi:MAG: UbiA family prenyltransferase [Candidatus Methanomethylicia archaeon]|nr:UbiA family prenyltransferase [Candidatus Methanomethylicia archaeon]MCX8169311.1 UbiA family prenyltransferase [Candidatus Methanomethylicia archaeon]MDW7988906.1 UbiA family prenyltransferase [Nitrososphaerota archaeon]